MAGPSPALRTVHILIEGRVQGVGFRAFVEREAMALDLAGWVRNRRTGAVEAILSGPDGSVEIVLGACRRGPQGARVDAVFVIADVDSERLGTFQGFAVHPTV
jgi:acylphosphatase